MDQLEQFSMNFFSLEGKVAVVTGGNTGLGQAYVVALPFDDGEETPAKLLKRCRDEVGPGGMTFIEGK